MLKLCVVILTIWVAIGAASVPSDPAGAVQEFANNIPASNIKFIQLPTLRPNPVMLTAVMTVARWTLVSMELFITNMIREIKAIFDKGFWALKPPYRNNLFFILNML